jgi:dTDP-4-amino-4,6-dideoxygalactose transaminase
LELPVFQTAEKTSSYHLFPIRIKGAKEEQRDEIMRLIFDQDVSVNVHFIPVPAMSYYKKLGYSEKHYPVAYDNYSREITLPLYYNLTNENVQKVCSALNNALKQVM